MQRLIDANNLMEYCLNQKDRTVDCNDIARFPTVLTIPDNLTNGDMIKAMFPNATIEIMKSSIEKTMVCVTWNFKDIPSYYNRFYEEWWNAPYKMESEDKEQEDGNVD